MRVFMCKPTYFDVIHKNLNVHMSMYRPVDKKIALLQFTNLTNFLRSINVDVKMIEPRENLVDMVFSANGALIEKKTNTAVIASFAAEPRKEESVYWSEFLRKQKYNIYQLNSSFEGQGDALFSHNNKILWVGYGYRTIFEAAEELQLVFSNIKVYPLRLANPLFYHLDTCFCVINETCVMYYPDAFDDESLKLIRKNFKDRIEVSDYDAMNFACNAVQAYNHIILNSASDELKDELANRKLTVIENDMSEFILSGGSVKCCVLHG